MWGWRLLLIDSNGFTNLYKAEIIVFRIRQGEIYILDYQHKIMSLIWYSQCIIKYMFVLQNPPANAVGQKKLFITTGETEVWLLIVKFWEYTIHTHTHTHLWLNMYTTCECSCMTIYVIVRHCTSMCVYVRQNTSMYVNISVSKALDSNEEGRWFKPKPILSWQLRHIITVFC